MAVYRSPRNDAAAKAFIQQHYGVMSYFVNDPEIGPLLMEAGYNQWTDDQLQTRLMSTNWYQQHSAAQREYQTLEHTDPASLRQKEWDMYSRVRDMASSMGLTDIDMQAAAKAAVQNGWSDALLRDMLSNHITMETVTQQQGAATTAFNTAKQYAAEYFLPSNDATDLAFARRVASGEMQTADIEAYYRERAKTEYAYMAPILDQGVTMAQYFNPHRQELSKLLEVAPDSVDFVNDPKYASILRTTDPTTGKARPMTLTEVDDWARQQDDWKHTQNAQQAASDMAAQMVKTFGGM